MVWGFKRINFLCFKESMRVVMNFYSVRIVLNINLKNVFYMRLSLLSTTAAYHKHIINILYTYNKHKIFIKYT